MTPVTPPSLQQRLAREVQGLHDRYWDDERKRCAAHRVILVEGDDDRDALEAMLGAVDVAWSTRVAVVVAGGRDRVLSRLNTTFPGGVGLVDRDVWTDAEANQRAAPYAGRLFVTSGWCLENTLMAARRPGEAPDLDETLERARAEWIRAGALWWTLQRTREAFNAWQERLGWTYGALRPDLALDSAAGLVASLETRIPAHLRHAAGLDLAALGAEYERRLQEVSAMAMPDQWAKGVRGKSAFSAVLVPWLNARYGQRSAHQWLGERARALPALPTPLDALFRAVL